ncbi:TetR/AcrR family transcriptional regulator [Brevibacillus nitrificans]|nr:TetR/AcrR family transcriptional regulator [Brevibacillus nitrificans]
MATKQKIFETGIRLFREKGYEATTVEEIAAAADVAKATFFKHFPRKYELILEVLMQRREKINLAVTDEQVSRLSTKMQVVHLMNILCNTIESDRTMAVISLNEYICSGDLLREEAPTIEIFYQTIERGRQKGEIRADIQSRVVARMLWAYYLESYIAWSRNEQERSLGAILLEGVEVMFRGIEAGKE